MNAPRKRISISGFALVLLLGLLASVQAQNGDQPQMPADAPQSQINQADQMLGPLNLTTDQIQRIRMINAELKEERQNANQRLRLAHRALNEAIQSPTPDETLIAQRSKEVADAQANTIRLRSLTEVRVLQVLTPEQRVKLRTMRNQAMNRNQRRNQQLPRILGGQQNGLQRNSVPPQQRRALRPPRQQRP